MTTFYEELTIILIPFVLVFLYRLFVCIIDGSVLWSAVGKPG